MKFFRYIIFLLATAAFLFCRCTPEGQLRRLVKRHPELMRVDTVKIIDTVIVPEIRVDTIIRATRFCDGLDTIIITKDRFHLKQYIVHDSLFIDGGCDGDTIVKTIYVPVEKLVYEEKEDWRPWIWLLVAVLMWLYLLYKHLTRK